MIWFLWLCFYDLQFKLFFLRPTCFSLTKTTLQNAYNPQMFIRNPEIFLMVQNKNFNSGHSFIINVWKTQIILRQRSFKARYYTATVQIHNKQHNFQTGPGKRKLMTVTWTANRLATQTHKRVWKWLAGRNGREGRPEQRLIFLEFILSLFSHSRSIYRFPFSRFARDRCLSLSFS